MSKNEQPKEKDSTDNDLINNDLLETIEQLNSILTTSIKNLSSDKFYYRKRTLNNILKSLLESLEKYNNFEGQPFIAHTDKQDRDIYQKVKLLLTNSATSFDVLQSTIKSFDMEKAEKLFTVTKDARNSFKKATEEIDKGVNLLLKHKIGAPWQIEEFQRNIISNSAVDIFNELLAGSQLADIAVKYGCESKYVQYELKQQKHILFDALSIFIEKNIQNDPDAYYLTLNDSIKSIINSKDIKGAYARVFEKTIDNVASNKITEYLATSNDLTALAKTYKINEKVLIQYLSKNKLVENIFSTKKERMLSVLDKSVEEAFANIELLRITSNEYKKQFIKPFIEKAISLGIEPNYLYAALGGNDYLKYEDFKPIVNIVYKAIYNSNKKQIFESLSKFEDMSKFVTNLKIPMLLLKNYILSEESVGKLIDKNKDTIINEINTVGFTNLTILNTNLFSLEFIKRYIKKNNWQISNTKDETQITDEKIEAKA